MSSHERVPSEFVEQGVAEALGVIHWKYATRPYHNIQHTKNVLRRTETILTALTSVPEGDFGPRLLDLGRLAAAFHDIEHVPRLTPENEEISAKQAVDWMRACNDKRQEIFRDSDTTIVQEAIMATVPKWSSDGLFGQPGLFEPYLTPASRLVAAALALADVAVAGLEGFEQYQTEGDQLFREKQEGTPHQTILASPQRRSDLSPKKKKKINDELIAWLTKQVCFATDLRDHHMPRVLALVDEGSREIMRDLFKEWARSIAESKKRLSSAEKQDIWAIVRAMVP
jgi:hypothetical protein